MPDSARYELNNPPVVAEMVDGEGIAINLRSGRYYSLLGPAAAVWNRLLEGCSPVEILQAVADLGSHDELGVSLKQFVDGLLAEELIRPAADASPRGSAEALQPWAAEGLRLERFTDMQDMLTLDPIHEIDDEFGWPRPAD